MVSINARTHHWCEQNYLQSYLTDSISSTNAWAKAGATGAQPLSVYLADHQTEGRGRGERTWTNSNPGATLLSTWCLKLEETPQPIFAIRCGLLLWECLCTVWPEIPWSLKAPNDIYVGDGKFAGILIEIEERFNTVSAFIGIGANILDAPSDLDQETFTLLDAMAPITDNDWSSFCTLLARGLLEFRKDAQRSLLTPAELERLLSALEMFPGNAVSAVRADGGLILQNNDYLHWNEL